MRARCAQRGGLGWAAQVSRFFVSKVSGASQGGVGGLLSCLRWRWTVLRELQFGKSLRLRRAPLYSTIPTRIDIGPPSGHAQE